MEYKRRKKKINHGDNPAVRSESGREDRYSKHQHGTVALNAVVQCLEAEVNTRLMETKRSCVCSVNFATKFLPIQQLRGLVSMSVHLSTSTSWPDY